MITCVRKCYLVICFFGLLLTVGCQGSEEPITDVPEPNLPPEKFQVKVEEVTHQSAKLNWTKAKDPDGDLVTYDIYLGQKLIADGLIELAFTINELEAQTEYSGTIVAKDSGKNEIFSEFRFETEELTYENVFNLNYGFNGACQIGIPYFIFETKEKNFIIVGTTGYYVNKASFFALEVDSEGDEIWKKIYHREYSPIIYSFKSIQTPEGFMIIVKDTIFYFDHSGEIIWEKTTSGYDLMNDVKIDSKGNIVLIGIRGTSTPHSYVPFVNTFVTKWDNRGNVLWEKDYIYDEVNQFENLLLSPKDEIIILGEKDMISTGKGSGDFWLLNLNEQGELLSEKTLSFQKSIYVPMAFVLTKDGGLVFSNGKNQILRLNSDYEEEEVIITDFDLLFSIKLTSDDGFIVVGTSESKSESSTLSFSKYDSEGRKEWDNFYREDHVRIDGRDVIQDDDGFFWIISEFWDTDDYAKPCDNLLLVKTDDFGRYK
ncbi:fibronectin type III domain-containing protein [Algoriphagus sp. D3-2-R+10]|uniref:fibronectin type III domain-containing protein n=1 Tax=Algoriphagus aurantiacus TaxID=3103948 RepID=UPI002B3F55FF|nr:fibronectin type III domain-containing protein [Algoriphagus sp. D3-2-R+10]MEB2777445.1 fibronectin type III domain-containing protein [Algoriphagus sp. D3-2-R+10]